MLDILKRLNIQQRLVFNKLQFIQKIRIGQAPNYLTEQFGYHLRNTGDFRPQQHPCRGYFFFQSAT